MADSTNTTCPVDASERTPPPDPMTTVVPAVVICHCVPEPDRGGQVAVLRSGTQRSFVIGRAGEHFFQQRPGSMVDCGRLRGETISSEQLVISPENDGADVHVVGRAPVFVDGTRVRQGQSVRVVPGAVIEVLGHSVFLFTRRPLALPPAHRLLLPLHPFGQVDSMGFAGESPPAWRVRTQAVAAAAEGLHVLIYGETGTGKELVAKAIHDKSVRAQARWVPVNCSPIPGTLSAVLLFGGIKNFPNPGTPPTKGYFAAAEGSTLFLDEIGEMPFELQTDLLRALESGYTVLGEQHPRPIKCVVVAATNRRDVGVKQDVRMRFPVLVETPSLAERREDIVPIMHRLLELRAARNTEFAARFARVDENGRMRVAVDWSLVVGLLRHPLQGNVREVEFILGRAIEEAAAGRALRWPTSVPEPPPVEHAVRNEAPHHTAQQLLEGLEARRPTVAPPPVVVKEPSRDAASAPAGYSKEQLLEVFQRVEFNYVKAAALLGISVDKLFRLRKRHGLA